MKKAIGKLAAAPLAAAFFYALWEPYRLQIRRRDCFLPLLPPEAEGLKVAHLSDLHVSALQSPRFLRYVVEKTNVERPDLVAITGDFISRRNSYRIVTGARIWAKSVDFYAHLSARELARLEAPLGVFATPGNHDVWNADFSWLEAILEKIGIQTLLNRAAVLPNGLPLVGLDDLRGGRPDYRRAFQNIAPEAAQLILSHNPRCAHLLKARNALILSGHTHGGQVRLPGGKRILPHDHGSNKWIEGVYRVGRSQLSVSVGIGSVGLPVRWGVAPEITIWTLRCLTTGALNSHNLRDNPT